MGHIGHITILDGYESVETQWITLYVNGDSVTYWYSFGVENIPKKLKNHRQWRYYNKYL